MVGGVVLEGWESDGQQDQGEREGKEEEEEEEGGGGEGGCKDNGGGAGEGSAEDVDVRVGGDDRIQWSDDDLRYPIEESHTVWSGFLSVP